MHHRYANRVVVVSSSPQHRVVRLEVPRGTHPGNVIEILVDARVFFVTIPPGHHPGTHFDARIPPHHHAPPPPVVIAAPAHRPPPPRRRGGLFACCQG